GALFHVVDVAHTRGRVVDVASLVDGVTGDPQRESVRDERHVDMATDTKARVIGLAGRIGVDLDPGVETFRIGTRRAETDESADRLRTPERPLRPAQDRHFADVE